MKISEIRDKTKVELAAQGRELRMELFNLKLQKASSQLEKPIRLRELRHDIARIETQVTQLRRTEALKNLIEQEVPHVARSLRLIEDFLDNIDEFSREGDRGLTEQEAEDPDRVDCYNELAHILGKSRTWKEVLYELERVGHQAFG